MWMKLPVLLAVVAVVVLGTFPYAIADNDEINVQFVGQTVASTKPEKEIEPDMKAERYFGQVMKVETGQVESWLSKLKLYSASDVSDPDAKACNDITVPVMSEYSAEPESGRF